MNNRFMISKAGAAFNIYSREGNFYYYDINDPQKDVATQIKALSKKCPSGCILGMGLGYELRYFSQKKQNNTIPAI